MCHFLRRRESAVDLGRVRGGVCDAGLHGESAGAAAAAHVPCLRAFCVGARTGCVFDAHRSNVETLADLRVGCSKPLSRHQAHFTVLLFAPRLQTAYFNEDSEQLSSGRPSNAARCLQQVVYGGHAAAHAALAFMHYGTYVGIFTSRTGFMSWRLLVSGWAAFTASERLPLA
jgi:hypothetical protein